MAIFPGESGLAGTRMSPFWILLELIGWWRWWWKLERAKLEPVESSQPTNQHPTFYRPDVVPWRYLTSNNVVTLKSGWEVTRGHRNRHASMRHLRLPINYIVTIVLSGTVSKINGDFCGKSPIFPTPVYSTPPPPEGRMAHKVSKNYNDGVPSKVLKIGLAVQTQYRHVTDRHPASQPAIFRIFDSNDRNACASRW